VAHRTAACVLIFAARSDYILPVDTHLLRVTRRLGLTRHDGVLTTAAREAAVSSMFGYGRDLAAAYFLFLLVGRTTCTATAPLRSVLPAPVLPLRRRTLRDHIGARGAQSVINVAVIACRLIASLPHLTGLPWAAIVLPSAPQRRWRPSLPERG
jgi:hypothetical protein